MRFPYLLALFGAILVAATFWYTRTADICPAPLSYRLGEIDDSFNLSVDEARSHIEAAELVWEQNANRELFVYDESAKFTVNFIFDERQELADSEAQQRETLDAQRSENDEIIASIETLQREYESLSANYRNRTAAYEERLKKYNQEVNKYNDRGGAPSDVFAELEEEREALNDEANELSDTAKELNDLAAQINRLSNQGNALVDEYNREVNHYNSQFGYSREFTQGDYRGKEINIYKFSTDTELESVLAHEFGHALGIDHVEGTSSVMYYLFEDNRDGPVLSVTDREAFLLTCGTGNELEHRIRRMIRNFLALITI